MIPPIRKPTPLQALAYLRNGQDLVCRKDFAPDGPLLFRAGRPYRVRLYFTNAVWTDYKPTSIGTVEKMKFSGYEHVFGLPDENGTTRWFCEQRLGRNVKMEPIDGKDFTLQDLIEHFEIPEIKDIAADRPEEYKAAKERLLCLTKITNT